MNSEDRKKLLDRLSNVKLGFIESKQDKYFREKLKKLSVSDYNDLMKRYVRKVVTEGFIDVDEFDKAIDELLEEKEIADKIVKDLVISKDEDGTYSIYYKENEEMTDTNVTLTKIANLIQEQSVLGNQINKLSEELPESFSWEKAVGVLPQGISFVAIRNKETKDWFTTDNYRFIFKRSWTNESDRSVMFPVGLIDLDSKAVIVFDLGDVKEDTDKTKSKVVLPFYPGFYIKKNIAVGIYAYPQYSVNINHSYTWFHLRDKDEYELVKHSNTEQIEEIGLPVIGYIPFDKIDSPAKNTFFEFYQAY